MKIITKIILIILLIGISIFAILKTRKKEKKLNIGIIQIAEHESLDKARNGFIDEMKNLGYDADFDIQIAGGDISNLNSIAQKFANDINKDLIFAISTPATQAIANQTEDVPILGTAVTDFEQSGLVKSSKHPGKNVSGTSDLVPVEKQIGLLKALVPNCKKVGILYSSGEANSKFYADMVSDELKKFGINAKHVTVSNSNEVKQAVQHAEHGVDTWFIPPDNLIASCMPTVSQVASEGKIPIICSFADAVNKGGLACYAVDYYELGKLTAKQADKILKKEAKIESMPIEYLEDPKLVINYKKADELGIKIPEKLKGELQ